MNIYIATKPLQIMICMILNGNNKDNYLYVANHFNNSQAISKSVTLKKFFKEVFWFNTRSNALRAAANEKPNFIYIDSDIGLKPLIDFYKLKLKSRRTEIHVYEEGVGTYRTDLIPWFKKIIYSIVGAGVYFGGAVSTKKIHVFNTNLYKENIPHLSRKAIEIEGNLATWIKAYKNELIEIFSHGFGIENIKKKQIAILYITDWHIDERLMGKLSKLDFFM